MTCRRSIPKLSQACSEREGRRPGFTLRENAHLASSCPASVVSCFSYNTKELFREYLLSSVFFEFTNPTEQSTYNLSVQKKIIIFMEKEKRKRE